MARKWAAPPAGASHVPRCDASARRADNILAAWGLAQAPEEHHHRDIIPTIPVTTITATTTATATATAAITTPTLLAHQRSQLVALTVRKWAQGAPPRAASLQAHDVAAAHGHAGERSSMMLSPVARELHPTAAAGTRRLAVEAADARLQ